MLDRVAPPEVGTGDWAPDPPDRYCPRCGLCVGPGEVMGGRCSRCRALKLPWQSLTRLGRYRPPLSDWVKRLKYKGCYRWAERLGTELAAALPSDLPPCTVVPTPMHVVRRYLRGLDHAELLALAVACQQGWPMRRLLRRRRLTPPQSSVPPSERMANLARAIEPKRLRSDRVPERVLLVDDVKTTGATLTRCCRALNKLGIREIHVAVVAVAEP
ncbi:ComF family protein [Mucisphaera calidilacus]|uniref:ComF family protein n=1 Tax=Mucisphaera calidilacus TaxID=2527982 RepID=UPI001F24BE14|nr:phosphoribosyltransferase family protein [Mucisphaera calidilacus]